MNKGALIEKEAEDQITNELRLLDEETKDGDELEVVTGSLRAVLRFAFEKAPLDMLAVNLIVSILSSITSEVTFKNLEKEYRNGN